MSTRLRPSLVALHPAWWRAHEIWLDTVRRQAAVAREWWAQRRASRQRAALRDALQHMSPHMLRDIGAPDDVVAHALVRESTAQQQRLVALRSE